ncbi:MAG: c-type cytochrome [Bacteroidota bacterium]|jgi:cytochrome c553|nr:cytochrome c [Ignavibacteria bacterium]HEX2962989.1 cytochrome c [Ignavibacteriales bacterium]MCU7500129.1 cytochrome c [Ignavibacteria bacterium]MCU7513248.1 cytochrome c [Ignavibacteria bacterium]MCU7519417.1 cytochrome c [Ignavibacteria bacterium]
MKSRNLVIAALFSVSVLASATVAQSKDADGKKIFEANKCTMCHSLKAENIQPTGKSKAPDLSTVGATQKPEWIQKFLTKQEKLEGKQHPIAFKGSDAELKTLANWLASHKK